MKYMIFLILLNVCCPNLESNLDSMVKAVEQKSQVEASRSLEEINVQIKIITGKIDNLNKEIQAILSNKNKTIQELQHKVVLEKQVIRLKHDRSALNHERSSIIRKNMCSMKQEDDSQQFLSDSPNVMELKRQLKNIEDIIKFKQREQGNFERNMNENEKLGIVTKEIERLITQKKQIASQIKKIQMTSFD